jgi:hypothetical protein
MTTIAAAEIATPAQLVSGSEVLASVVMASKVR